MTAGTFADPLPANERVCPRCREGELERVPASLTTDLLASMLSEEDRATYQTRCLVICEGCGWEGTSETLRVVEAR